MYLTRQHRWPEAAQHHRSVGKAAVWSWKTQRGWWRGGWTCCVYVVRQSFHTLDAHAQFPHSCRLASLVGWREISHLVKDLFTTQTYFVHLCIISVEMKWTEDSATSLWNVFAYSLTDELRILITVIWIFFGGSCVSLVIPKMKNEAFSVDQAYPHWRNQIRLHSDGEAACCEDLVLDEERVSEERKMWYLSTFSHPNLKQFIFH